MLVQEGGGDDLVSEVGNEIKVAIDRWSVGQVGVADLIAAVAILAVGALLAWIVSRTARRFARRTESHAGSAFAALGLLGATSVMLLAAALALEVLGFSLGPILVIVVMVIVALLLLRPLVTNMSSGVLLQARGALEVGDLVSTNDVFGTVAEINARSVVIDTADGRRAHIPNTDVLEATIENHTTLGRRRSSFDVTIDRDADIDRALSVMRDAVRSADAVLDDPPPEVQIAGVLGRFVVMRTYVWHGPATVFERTAVHAGVRSVLSACADAGIELDGPELVALRGLGDEAT